MKMKAVRIQLNGGLEARPVAMLVQVASQHDSTVYLESEGKKVNAKVSCNDRRLDWTAAKW